jgi:hypothetical protein
MPRLLATLLVGLTVSAAGCALGPKAIERTHGRYAEAVQRVEEEQFLAGVVRLRYVEASTELAVSAIATQYEVSATAEARPFFGTESLSGPLFRTFSAVLPFASVGGANRPTVSLTPQDDGAAVRQFLTPITADTLVFLGQTGWPVSGVLRIWVDRMNGVPNWVAPSGPLRDTPPDFTRFRRATELLQAAQDRELISVHGEDGVTELSGPLPAEAVTATAAVAAAEKGFEYRPRADGSTWALVRRERRFVLQVNPAGRGSPELAELAALLNLKPGLERYEAVLAAGVPDPVKNPTEPAAVLRFAPRSTAQALFFLANGVDVPPDHVAAGLVRLPPDGSDPAEATRGVFRVHSCPGHKHSPPACAYTAVWYRDHWFYIDDRDQDSKATLALMLQLRRLDFRRQQVGSVPALTLPVGR